MTKEITKCNVNSTSNMNYKRPNVIIMKLYHIHWQLFLIVLKVSIAILQLIEIGFLLQHFWCFPYFLNMWRSKKKQVQRFPRELKIHRSYTGEIPGSSLRYPGKSRAFSVSSLALPGISQWIQRRKSHIPGNFPVHPGELPGESQ